MYDIIYADPAWSYTKGGTADAGAHYAMMEWNEIADMPIRDLCNKKAAVFMWATGPLLDRQINMYRWWGLKYRGVAFVWVKTRKDGGIIGGQGPRPTFVKPTTEFLLVGTNHPKGRPFPILNEGMGQVVLAPREAHSKKPDVFRDKIVELCGDRPRIELFARDRAPGWDASGLELDGTDYRFMPLCGTDPSRLIRVR